LIIATPGGVFVTEDQGVSWTGSGDIPTTSSIFMLALDPVTPDRVFAATSDGIYRSLDFGGSWLVRNHLPTENLFLTGSLVFETWQDTTIVIDSTTAVPDTTIMVPYIYDRALRYWIYFEGRQGEPPAEDNPLATKMIFTPDDLLLANTRYQVRILGIFEDDRETLKNSYGARDIDGNSFETDNNFTFTIGKD
jgi:hypothetical protein